MTAGTLELHLRAPLTPADVDALCLRVREQAADVTAALLVCVLTGPAEVSVVDALARVGLTARREGLAVRVRCDGGPLRPLLQLCGLDDVLPPLAGLPADEVVRRPSSALSNPHTEEHTVKRMIFVNLPVEDLAVTCAFWAELGFSFNETFSDDRSACLVIEDNICAMLMTRDRFADVVHGEIADAHAVTEVLTCLSCGSPQEVDDLVGRALAAGGKPWQPTMTQGPMHGGSFQDPDGHVWELVHMDMSQASS
jgi:predicted lactoylglutathione lyase